MTQRADLAAMFSSKVNTWGTPRDFYRMIHRLLGFTLDACALPGTAKLKHFVHAGSNGLNVSWDGERVFDNPPYNDCKNWMLKARNESLEGSCLSANLVPKRGDTKWWSTGVLSEDGNAGKLRDSWYDDKNRVWWLVRRRLITAIYEHDGRMTFEDGTRDETNNAPFPSALIIHATPGIQPKLREGITLMWPR